MAPERAPAFQFYADKFLLDENQALMDLDQAGAYVRLMAYCWRELTIPDDPVKCLRLVGSTATPERMADMWPLIRACFAPANEPGRLIHPTLEKERQKQAEWREKSAEGGKRHGKGGSRVDEPPLKHPSKGGSTKWQPTGNTLVSSLQSPSPDQKNIGADAPASRHQEFVDAYFARFTEAVGTPPKCDGKDFATIKRLLKSRGMPELLRVMAAMFDSTDDFIRKSGYSIGFLSSQYNKLLVASKGRPDEAAARKLGPDYSAHWYDDCEHEPRCLNLAEHRLKRAKEAA